MSQVKKAAFAHNARVSAERSNEYHAVARRRAGGPCGGTIHACPAERAAFSTPGEPDDLSGWTGIQRYGWRRSDARRRKRKAYRGLHQLDADVVRIEEIHLALAIDKTEATCRDRRRGVVDRDERDPFE